MTVQTPYRFPRPTICLGMIVKNEENVIDRCLRSVEADIDGYVIHDTGSTDDTEEVVDQWHVELTKKRIEDGRKFTLDGLISHVPWKDFGTNRSDVLSHIRSEPCHHFTLMLDADEELNGSLNDAIHAHCKTHGEYMDTYQIPVLLGTTTYLRNFVFSNDKPFYFEGVIHEYPECTESFTTGILGGISITSHHDGARSKDPDKYKKDCELFDRIVEQRDLTPRETFYFAQSLRDACRRDDAVVHYNRRVKMRGYGEEVFYSYLMLGKICDNYEAFFSAYQMRPNRMEPLFYLAKRLMDRCEWHAAFLLLKNFSVHMPIPDGLFVEKDVYQWRGAMELAVAAYWVGDNDLAIQFNNELLDFALGDMPAHAYAQVQWNQTFILSAPQEGMHPCRI